MIHAGEPAGQQHKTRAQLGIFTYCILSEIVPSYNSAAMIPAFHTHAWWWLLKISIWRGDESESHGQGG